ncbi:hypothetical protein SAMD00019534_050870 [Acytostelium subglobosum LB1]|uniref:hypothetical protein n=1 Tax=Acytostelium subglobosum LB1 TaxID=1410327 RepID=UPI000645079E|nr:hypothetical protein SAMD00019534_050870 [Acytostelium subglobosum LB1]GAM21912.1 hypothetical protein SAMD00019534_050870 [Acytostelium subglobosum LB1]|eukprot:XP_012755012.1 hypothetical protein SAMD00019534_050870 [Acytostelium subglobosum LB1]
MITDNAGIIEKPTDNKTLAEVLRLMSRSLNKQRQLYTETFPLDEDYTIKYIVHPFKVINASITDCFLMTEPNVMLQSRRPVDVGGYTMYKSDNYRIGINYRLVLHFDEKEGTENKCPYVQTRIYRDHAKMMSIQEMICHQQWPLVHTDESTKPDRHRIEVDNASFKIQTYNLWNYNSPWVTRRQLIVDDIVANDPDFIAFQEPRYSPWQGESNFKPNLQLMGQERNQIQHLVKLLALQNKKYHYVFHPSMVYVHPDKFEYEGLAMLSKYNIKEKSSIKLSKDFHDEEDVHQRSCLRLLVDSPIGDVNLFTSHFSLSLEGAQRNALEVIDWAKQFESPSIPQVFVGDLNSLPQSSAVQLLLGKKAVQEVSGDFMDSFEVWTARTADVTLPQGTYSTLQGTEPTKRIDYIMSRGGLELTNFKIIGGHTQAENHETIYASDHLSLVSTFKRLKERMTHAEHTTTVVNNAEVATPKAKPLA